MNNQLQKQAQGIPVALKSFFAQEKIVKKFESIAGKHAQTLITSALQVCNGNSMLAKATPQSIYGSVMTAATMNLPINNNLGFAYIVPFYNGKTKCTEAQFQIGYKGLIQLAKRSGQCKSISTAPIYEGQLLHDDPLMGCEFDFDNKTSDKIIGYAAYYEEINGFSKTLYSPIEKIKAHAKKYSKTYNSDYGVWETNFDEMAQKTVLRQLLSKFATMTIEMQEALVKDQSVVDDNGNASYVDAMEENQSRAALVTEAREAGIPVGSTDTKEEILEKMQDGVVVEPATEAPEQEATTEETPESDDYEMPADLFGLEE